MPTSKAFREWQEAERLFIAAFKALTLSLERHQLPTEAERANLTLLREIASQKLHLMLEELEVRVRRFE